MYINTCDSRALQRLIASQTSVVALVTTRDSALVVSVCIMIYNIYNNQKSYNTLIRTLSSSAAINSSNVTCEMAADYNIWL